MSQQLLGTGILVIDDQLPVLFSVRKILERHGALVTTVLDVETAIETIERNKFDAIITDINMPEASGYDLIKLLREAEVSVPVVAMSGCVDFKRCYEEGFSTSIEKPCKEDELITAVSALLGH
jgi:two-component system sensor histidine kinase/response regulator